VKEVGDDDLQQDEDEPEVCKQPPAVIKEDEEDETEVKEDSEGDLHWKEMNWKNVSNLQLLSRTRKWTRLRSKRTARTISSWLKMKRKTLRNVQLRRKITTMMSSGMKTNRKTVSKLQLLSRRYIGRGGTGYWLRVLGRLLAGLLGRVHGWAWIGRPRGRTESRDRLGSLDIAAS
jgi:hypothetical protein